ncbi:hypothetical protein ABRP64_11260 [Corynebacterium sp. KPL4015]|uniref:hypothetical protein n=1 Tax=Corynebacterium sp. KPL4015 TaxID=3158326 RepID=UPI0032EF4889
MPKSLTSSWAILAVTAVAFVAGCSNSDEANNADSEPNFTGSNATSDASEETAPSDTDDKGAGDEDSAKQPSTATVPEKAQKSATARENKIIPVEDLYSLWVPALCEHGAGTLVDGTLPEHLKTGYPNAAAGLKLNEDGTPKGAYADINGDGKDEGVITYVCDQGGVAWPDNLLIYDNDLNYITQVEDWTRNGMEPARRHINQLEWTNDTVTVTWRAHGEGESGAVATHELTGNLTLDGDKANLEMTGHRKTS